MRVQLLLLSVGLLDLKAIVRILYLLSVSKWSAVYTCTWPGAIVGKLKTKHGKEMAICTLTVELHKYSKSTSSSSLCCIHM